MKILRKELLKKLKTASIGIAANETVEQSDCFVFTEEYLVTFNDEVMTRVKSPLDFEAVVPQADILKILSKMAEEELDISRKGSELIIKGSKQRKAGITCHSECLLPFDAVPSPGKWKKIKEGAANMLQQAARTCGRDESNPMTTCVHITPNRIEACDNYRMFRCDMKTGFGGEVLIPASTVMALGGLEIQKVSIGEGWVHFRVAGDCEIACRCSHSDYANVDPILEIKDPEKLSLPETLSEMISRAEIMTDDEEGGLVKIQLKSNTLTITSRKDAGWYREKEKIKYTGPDLSFEVHPKFLVNVLEMTHKVLIGSGKMKLETDDIKFVVCLEV